MRRGVCLLSLLLTGCWGHFLQQRCLSGAPPRVGRAMPDEMFALLRRELDRAHDKRRSPLVRAAILEPIPSLIPDVSELANEPTCGPELGAQLRHALTRRPLPFSRLALAELRTLHQVGDTSDVMDAKGASLMRLAVIDDREVAPYHFEPGESGATPTPDVLRFWARASLVGSNLFLNLPTVRTFLGDGLQQVQDDREQLLLVETGRAVFDQALFGHVTRPVGDAAPALLRAWIADAAQRIERPGERVARELVRQRIYFIGAYGTVFGLDPPARALLGRIAALRGRLPLVAGDDDAAVDLAMAARTALIDLDRPFDHMYRLDVPPSERGAIHPWAEWVAPYPTVVHYAEADRAARVAELDDELRRLHSARARCHVLAQLAEWAPSAERERRHAELVAPLFATAVAPPRSHNEEGYCRLRTALLDERIAAEQRIELALRVLRQPSTDINGNGLSWAIVQALADHPEWVDASEPLRALLAAHALSPLPDDKAYNEAISEEKLAPVYVALLRWDRQHDRERGRRVLAAWMESLRGDLPVRGVVDRMRAVARFAGDFDLAPDARTLIAARIATHLPPRAPTPDFMLRELTLAAYRLDWR